MPATAPNRTSLPERGRRVNPQPTEITAVRARCEARMAVVCDTALSSGARLLYVLLDDYAGMGAKAWPHQDTLADRLGVTERQVKRWVSELKAAGKITPRRTQDGNRYGLAWQGTKMSHAEVESRDEIVTPHGTKMSPASYEPVLVNQLDCPHCGGTGERTYSTGGGYERGRAIPVRTWRGPCGCTL